jgi:SHS2 domain-containing protein
MGRWEERDHTADLAIHVWARSLEDLFATAARGMFSLMTDVEEVVISGSASVTLTAHDEETLLVDWLNELLYLSERDGPTVYVDFDITTLTPTTLQATARGGPVVDYRSVIKAVTFHNLEIREQEGGGYEVDLIFDT